MTSPETLVGRQCDELAERAGFKVVRFSQRRASEQTPGIPDRYYRHKARGFRLWFEVKVPGDRLTRDQHEFLVEELAAGGLAACGGFEELRALLALSTLPGLATAARRAGDIVSVWAAKGFRGERLDGQPYRRRASKHRA